MILKNWMVGGVVFFYSVSALPSGKKKTEPDSSFNGKKVVGLTDFPIIRIEMPDGSLHGFGDDLQGGLVGALINSGKYIVNYSDQKSSSGNLLEAQDIHWQGTVTPAATIRIQVNALSFSTGTRGESMFYGFDERFRTSFNDGFGTHQNEFPLRAEAAYEPSWFGASFDGKGISPFDSHSGLDLGDGFNIDVLYAWLKVKYARYHSELRLQLMLDLPFGGTIKRPIEVKGDGFFFDVAGAYQNYSGGISIARRDAMTQAVNNALSATFDSIDQALSPLPKLAKADDMLDGNTVLLGTGPLADIKPGLIYHSVDHPEIQVAVQSSNSSGSIAQLVQGNYNDIRVGMIFQEGVQEFQSRAFTAQAAGDSIQLPETNLPASNLDGTVPVVTRMEAFLLSLKESVFLPYRIWRYFTYDQTYHAAADWGGSTSLRLDQEAWASKVGLDSLLEISSGVSPIVAVLDSGVDYNHPVIHSHIWENPFPWTDVDGQMDQYGWDFVSEDSRPYDDGYHGTQIASLVASVAPQARILPVKIFNPWGITSSAAVYAGFVYAVDHGAQIILCGWTTGKMSDALKNGVEYARQHGVLVVAAAGDFSVNLERAAFYPAVYSGSFDNVLTVTGVNGSDQLASIDTRKANSSVQYVGIAAPGENIPVAEPRMTYTRDSSTALSAALVAGAVARNLTASGLEGDYSDWIRLIQQNADVVDGLKGVVAGGYRLHIRR